MNASASQELVASLGLQNAGWPQDLADSRKPAFFSKSGQGGRVTWYAVAHSPRQARELREYLLAFVGPSYSDFSGQVAAWNKADSLEAKLATLALHGFRLNPKVESNDVVEKSFARLRQMLHERPLRKLSDPPSLARLLSDFELFLRESDWSAAGSVIDQIRDRGQLTSDQLAGLNLRLLSKQDRWAEVLSAPELPAMTVHRMPVAVAEAVAVAVFNEHLAKFQTEGEAINHFQMHVGSAFGLLFRQRNAWRHPEAVKLAKLADASAKVLITKRQAVDQSPLEAIKEACEVGDFENAFSLLKVGPFTAESLRLLVEVALDLGSPEAARTALEAVNRCEVDVRNNAFARRASKAILEELQGVAGREQNVPPSNWFEWLSWLADGSLPDPIGAVNLLGAQWPQPSPLDFNKALEEKINKVFPTLRNVLSALMEVLIPGGVPDPHFAPSYLRMLEHLVLDDDLSVATAPAVAEFAAAVLRAGPVANQTRNDYQEVTEFLIVAWEHLRQPAMFDWGLGVLDLAAECAIHRHADVTLLVQYIAAEFVRAPRHVTSSQRWLLQNICNELEKPEVAELLIVPAPAAGTTAVDESETLRKKLGRRRVVLLTLSDRIASTFRQMMREKYPNARLDVVQEYSSTDRLKDAASSADVFIVNTYDAKHAATTAVPRCRPENAPTLYPEGKNAARQLDILEVWLKSLA